MTCEPTLRLGRTRSVDVRSSSSGTLSPIRFSAAYTIDTLEYSFRKRQPELRALRPLQGKSPYVFTTEAGTPVTTAWFLRMVQRTGRAAKLPFPLHPHMLRHACGYKLANDGHDTRSLAHYLGHRNLQSTARYTALAPDRFARIWQD